MKTKLWCDMKTDAERVAFLKSGRAVETGIIAQAIVDDVAQVFAFRSTIKCSGRREAVSLLP